MSREGRGRSSEEHREANAEGTEEEAVVPGVKIRQGIKPSVRGPYLWVVRLLGHKGLVCGRETVRPYAQGQ